MEAGAKSNISEETSSDGGLYNEVIDPKKLSKAGQAEFERAKNFISTVGSKSKLSLYDHLRDILHQVIRHNIEDAADQLEDISRSLKDKLEEETAAFDEDLKKFFEEKAKFYGLPKSAAEGDGKKETSHHSPDLSDLPYIVGRFAQCGFGCLSPDEAHDLGVALKNLASEHKLKNIRFWGKVFTNVGEYFVAESPYQEGMDLNDFSHQKSTSSEHQPAEKSPESEKDGVGANEYVYFACTQIGQPWKSLPSLKPHHVIQARKLKRFLTGNLESEVGENVQFAGKEAHYLRAQIARISAGTCIAPVDYYTQTGLGEDKNITRNEGFKAKPAWEAYNAECEFWVHSRRALLDNGRCTPVRAESKADLSEDVQEDAVPLFRSLTYDQVGDDIDLWNFKLSSKLSRENAVLLVRSSMWPGACTFYDGKSFEHLYLGYGYKEKGYEGKKTGEKVPEVARKFDEKQKDGDLYESQDKEEEYLDESVDGEEKQEFFLELETEDHKVDTERKTVDEDKGSDQEKMFQEVHQESDKKVDEKVDDIERKVQESSDEGLQKRSVQKVLQREEEVNRKENEDKLKEKESSEVLDEGMTVKKVIQEGKDVIRKKSEDEVEEQQSSEEVLEEGRKSAQKVIQEEKELVGKKSKGEVRVEGKELIEEVIDKGISSLPKEIQEGKEVLRKESKDKVKEEPQSSEEVLEAGKELEAKESKSDLKTEEKESNEEVHDKEIRSVRKVLEEGKEEISEDKEKTSKKGKDENLTKKDFVKEKFEKDDFDQLGIEKPEVSKDSIEGKIIKEGKLPQKDKLDQEDIVKAEGKEAIAEVLEVGKQKLLQEGKEAAEKKSTEAAGKRSTEASEKRSIEAAEKRSTEAAEKRSIEAAEKRSTEASEKRSIGQGKEKERPNEGIITKGTKFVPELIREAVTEKSKEVEEAIKKESTDQDTVKKASKKRSIEAAEKRSTEAAEKRSTDAAEKRSIEPSEKRSTEASEKRSIGQGKEKERPSKGIITKGTKSVPELIQEAVTKKSKEVQEAIIKESTDQDTVKKESQEKKEKEETASEAGKKSWNSQI